jgi:integrase/recombinase XerC
MGRADLAGAAHLQLVSGVVPLRPEDAMVDAMLKGGEPNRPRADCKRTRSHRGSGWCTGSWISPTDIRGTPSHMDEWTQSLTAERHLAPSTIRGKQTDLRLFSEYVTDGRYGWAVECAKAFGTPSGRRR